MFARHKQHQVWQSSLVTHSLCFDCRADCELDAVHIAKQQIEFRVYV